MLSNALGFRLYWLMMGINTITFVTVWFFWPETKLLSLEAMDEVMGSIAARASLVRLPEEFTSDEGEITTQVPDRRRADSQSAEKPDDNIKTTKDADEFA